MTNRTNEEWIAELRGDAGADKQRQAHLDLGRYLHTIAYNHLLTRQNHLAGLRDLSSEELAALAEDFTQETLYKLSDDSFRQLDRFDERGRFTSWAAAIVVNEARQELRRSYWTRRAPMSVRRDRETGEELEASEYVADSAHTRPEQKLLNREVEERLQKCIDALPADRRHAFQECQMNGRPAQDVANETGTSRNAIYILIYRTKQELRKCLEQAGIGPGDWATS
jgi:RNA polymerase sigma-70 factor (ECF subfamily)